MSSWFAALGPCASPKSKAKEQKPLAAQTGRPLSLSSIKRRGSLTDVRPTNRKVSGSRSFREKIQDTFEGGFRKVKKTGSLEVVNPHARGETYGNPDTNMNVSTSLRPKAYRGNSSDSYQASEAESSAQKDKFWTNFYNTLPRNRHKERPKDLSLQDLPVTEMDSETDLTQKPETGTSQQKSSSDQWQGYATSPRTKRKNKTLERMNSAPNSRNSPIKPGYEPEHRAASDGNASPQILELTENPLFDSNGSGFVVMPRSVSMQEEYWVPGMKTGSKVELRKVTASPDRMLVRHSPAGSPMPSQGQVWVRTKDGSHVELHTLERLHRDLPSPSESQKTDSSSIIYNMTANSLTSQIAMVPKFPVEDRLPSGYTSSTTQTQQEIGSLTGSLQGSYMSPEEYQANIFDLINSLNQSPPNPASPEVKRFREMKGSRSPDVVEGHFTEDGQKFHSEKYIILGQSEGQVSKGDEK
ncbi:hypothetical protein DPMN_102841, partial [Dreissena polymorpha]